MRFLARAINFLGRRWGIRPFPWANECELDEAGGEHQRLFDQIHRENYWESEKTLSGGGSTIERTKDYAKQLENFILKENFESIFDAPCGDLNWIMSVVERTGVVYSGGDVSQLAIDAALQRYPDANVRLFDICNEKFPEADVWHCRDCLFHLSFEDGLGALRNFARSNIPHALLTTNTARWMPNIDIKTGGWRALDLQGAPFNLPKPRFSMKDYPAAVEFPRYVGWWTREEIIAAL